MAVTQERSAKVAGKTNGKDKENECITFRHLLREGVNGYVFWCLLQGLAPMIWFYPLNEMEISGYEAFACLWFIQIITGISFVRKLFEQNTVLCILRGLTVMSLASFQAPTTLDRLIILAAGNGIVMLTLTASLWNSNKTVRSATCWGLALGFVAFVASRVWFVSFVPTWWSNQSNSVVVAIGAMAVVDQFISGYGINEEETAPSKPVQRPYILCTAIGFGSLMFLLNWVFGEASLITRWTVRPYPDHGPDPFPWGAGTLIALCFGAYMSSCRHVATSKIWWLFGLIAFGCLYYFPTWQGYCGGLTLAVYAMSIWPEMADRVSRCPPASTLALALLTFVLQNFFLVWCVAYNFVPLGVYTRERTDILIALNMLGIFIGLFVGGSLQDDGYTSYTTKQKNKPPNSYFNSVLAVILCIGLLGYGVRYNPNKYNHPQKTDPKMITTAIWTYHFGYDNKGWPSLERTAKLLNDTGADVITMLESDASKPFLGNNDLGMWLEERLGLYVDFGPATKDHTWGNMILSKYPIVKSKHHLMPSPHGELAPAITATINVSGNYVDFVVCHFGNNHDEHRDDLDRQYQAEYLSYELRSSENPVIFMGYVTSKPGSKEYKELINKGNMKDIDASDQKRFCEYIMYRGLSRLAYGRITHGGLSDTELQIAKFEIPDDPDNIKDNPVMTNERDNVREDVLFDEKFGEVHHGHGYFPDHRFHMSTPKYFHP